jgi:hypothetical protein
VGIERIGIKLHLRLRLRRRHKGFLETFRVRRFPRGAPLGIRPVVGVVGDAHHDFLRGNELSNRRQIGRKPVLRGNRAGRRRQPVIVVVHQDDGVGFPPDGGVVIAPIRRGQGHHELEVRAVQRGGKLAEERGEIPLAALRHLFEVNRKPGLLCRPHPPDGLVDQVPASRRLAQHRGHFRDMPLRAVGVVQQSHHGDLDARRLHPRLELRIVFEIEPPVGRNRMQLLGNEQVNVAVMPLERGQTAGIPADIEGNPQGGVPGGYLPQRGYPAKASETLGLRPGQVPGQHGVTAGASPRQEHLGQVHMLDDGEEEYDQQEGKYRPADLQHAARATPAAALLIVENGLALGHCVGPS